MNVGAAESPVLLAPAHGPLETLTRDVIARSWRWIRSQVNGLAARQRTRRLRVSETISLGEKRFVSILEVDGEQLLIGGGAENLVLLAKLESPNKDLPVPAEPPAFGEALSRAFVSPLEPDSQESRPAISAKRSRA